MAAGIPWVGEIVKPVENCRIATMLTVTSIVTTTATISAALVNFRQSVWRNFPTK